LDFLVLGPQGLHGSGDGRIGQASLDSWGPRTIQHVQSISGQASP
jgi:hypothetical protein